MNKIETSLTVKYQEFNVRVFKTNEIKKKLTQGFTS